MTEQLRRELEVASRAAEAAGQLLLRYFRQDLRVEHKRGREPVSEADRASERLILGQLRREFPSDGILAEESGDKRAYLAHRRAWLVDPLDGTRHFLRGRQGFSVMIGLLCDFRPALGVIHQPTTGLTYRATGSIAEMVAGGRTSTLRTSARADLAGARLAGPREPGLPVDSALQHQFHVGSIGLKLALIARGDRELYVNPAGHSRLWDTCASEAILIRAGGRITDSAGDPLVYDDPRQLQLQRGVVASNGRCHEAALARLASATDG